MQASYPRLRFTYRRVPPRLVPPFRGLIHLCQGRLLNERRQLLPRALQRLMRRIGHLPSLLFGRFRVPTGLYPTGRVLFQGAKTGAVFDRPYRREPSLFSFVRTAHLFRNIRRANVVGAKGSAATIVSKRRTRGQVFLFNRRLPVNQFNERLRQLLLGRQYNQQVVVWAEVGEVTTSSFRQYLLPRLCVALRVDLVGNRYAPMNRHVGRLNRLPLFQGKAIKRRGEGRCFRTLPTQASGNDRYLQNWKDRSLRLRNLFPVHRVTSVRRRRPIVRLVLCPTFLFPRPNNGGRGEGVHHVGIPVTER